MTKEKLHDKPCGTPRSNAANVRMPRQRRLEREADPGGSIAVDLLEHQTPRAKRRSVRIERRQSGRDQIRIDEVRAAGLVRQELPCERRLSGAVGTGDDHDLLLRAHCAILADRVQTRTSWGR